MDEAIHLMTCVAGLGVEPSLRDYAFLVSPVSWSVGLCLSFGFPQDLAYSLYGLAPVKGIASALP